MLTVGDRLREGAYGALVCALACETFYHSRVLLLPAVIAAFVFYPLTQCRKLQEQKLWRLTLEFREAVWMVSGYLSAGLSVENACRSTLAELRRIYGDRAMITKEFSHIVRGLRLNRQVELLLIDFADRSGLEDIRSFAEVFSIAKRSGGDLGEIIERTTDAIREKTAVTEEIRNLTASRRYEQNIMNFLPFGMIIYIRLTSPGFLDVMYGTAGGRILMSCGLLLLLGARLLSRRILDIRV